MQIIKVSVIVPIYKAEHYIERCVRSLMVQTLYEDIEFIFINDCTPDNSMSIINKVIADYPNRKPQIRIINHEHNYGISFTRSEAIKLARGEYIGWCDSDDWCENNMFERLYFEAQSKNVDVVVCDYFKVFSGDRIEKGVYHEFDTPQAYLDSIYRIQGMVYSFSVLWNKIIRRSFLIENSIFPYEGINRSEDLNIMVRVCTLACSISFINEPFYYYNKQNSSSITTTKIDKKKDLIQQEKNVLYLQQFLLDKKVENRHIISGYLKWLMKMECQTFFLSNDDFYYQFRDCHKLILFFSLYPLSLRFRIWLVFLNHFFFSFHSLFFSRTRHHDNY